MWRQTKTQQQRITVLFVTNGEKTEQQYLSLLKGAIHQKHGKKYSVKVKHIKGAPGNLLSELTRPNGDASAYDQVWLVVDKDDFSLESFLADCRKEDKERKKQNNKKEKKGQAQAGQDSLFKAVVSNPCFEVWLVAFFGKISHYQNRDEVKRDYEKRAGLPKNTKDLPDGIHLGSLSSQSANAKLAGAEHPELNTEGVPPGTSIPHMLKFYDLI